MMTAAEFEARFGVAPKQDDLERANCDQQGDIGHQFCGVCPDCQRPRFLCGHYLVTGGGDGGGGTGYLR